MIKLREEFVLLPKPLDIPLVEWLELKDTWLSLSDRVVDPNLKQLIRDEWSVPPTALQIAKVLRAGSYFRFTSNVTVRTLVYLYQAALHAGEVTEAEIDATVEEWFIATYPSANASQIGYCSIDQDQRTTTQPPYDTAT